MKLPEMTLSRALCRGELGSPIENICSIWVRSAKVSATALFTAMGVNGSELKVFCS